MLGIITCIITSGEVTSTVVLLDEGVPLLRGAFRRRLKLRVI
jgi:hypothetical protein